MPRQEIKYICDVCNAKFNEKKLAIDCENSHFSPKEITKVSYESADKKNEFPATINVLLENKKGERRTITYKRG